MRARFMLLAALAFALNTALADEHDDASPEQADQTQVEERTCFNRRLVDSFDGLSDRHVFIEERGKNYYLLTMRTRCTGLRDAKGIGIKDTMSRVCPNSFGEIIYRDMGRVERCRIGDIVRVESKDEARAIIREQEQHEKAEKEAARKKDD